ncbi:hypothetical protein C8F04DRAFT_55724 [Mycena alexandri]|uniref:Uncharacterized protein n=1 Tax=Mycena alexandri TaxID=1745969 RepID=A0AAD6TCK1_9AGAR|nr:hypothetical protein C8F04DRAFT_55724 [Mycena alexandri]
MSALEPPNPQQTFGVLFIGFALSMTGYGFTFFQTYVYFSGYPADHWVLKLFVFVIFALDTVTSALVSSAHTYMVLSLPYIGGLVELQRTFNAQFLLSTIMMLGVHLFFSLRVWKLSRNIWAAGLAAVISVAAFSLGIGMITTMFKTPLFAHLDANRALISLVFGSITLASLVEFIALVQYSKRSPGLCLLHEAYLCLFPRDLIGTAIWFGCMLLFLIQPHNVYWVPMYLTAVKVSINAMLNMLNLRESFRGKGLNEEDPPPPTRTGHSQSSNTHHGTAMSNMFNHTTNAKVVHTVDHDRVIDVTSKGIYSSDDDPTVTFRSVDTI